MKGQMYEGGIRVPGLIEWPAKISAARRSDFNAVTSDMLPTACELAGTPIPDNRPLDGLSLVPLLNGELEQRPSPIFFWNFQAKGKPKTDGKPWIDPDLQKGTTPLVKLMGNIATRNFRNNHHPEIRPTDYLGTRVMLGNRYKLIVNGGAGDSEAKVELYDLNADLAETEDVAESQSDIAKLMQKDLRKWQDSVLKSLTGADYRD